MSTPENKAMMDILQKLQDAQNNTQSSSNAHDSAQKSAHHSSSVSKDAQEMFNILSKLDQATNKVATEKFQEAKTNVSLSTATMVDDTVTVGKYNVVLEKKNIITGIKKTYYKVTNHSGDTLYEDIALFETAMGIVKGLLFNKTQKVHQLVELDARYGSYVAESAIYKHKAKTLTESHKQDVALAKQTQAVSKMMAIKKQIKTLL